MKIHNFKKNQRILIYGNGGCCSRSTGAVENQFYEIVTK